MTDLAPLLYLLAVPAFCCAALLCACCVISKENKSND